MRRSDLATLGSTARHHCSLSRVLARLACAYLVVRILFTPAPASAQAAPPASHDDDAFDVMNLLARQGLHDIDDESWNAYGQFTYISSWKLPFHAPYTNANGSINSLVPDCERSFTGSVTLFFGLRLWPGGEAYFVPEVDRRAAALGAPRARRIDPELRAPEDAARRRRSSIDRARSSGRRSGSAARAS